MRKARQRWAEQGTQGKPDSGSGNPRSPFFSPTIASPTPPSPEREPAPSTPKATPVKRLKDKGGGIAGGRQEYQPRSPTKRRTVDSAPSRLPIGALILFPESQAFRETSANQGSIHSSPATLIEEDIFMDQDTNSTTPTNNPPPGHAQEQMEEQTPPFVFPSSWRDPLMLSNVSAADSPHANGAEFIPEGPEQERLVARFQPNLGNFEGSAFHHVDLLENLDPSQLAVITKDVGDYALGVIFNGGRKFTEMAKPKPWETLNTIFIPLTGGDGSFKAYQGLPDKYQEDKLGPPVIVVLELTGTTRDILLRQRILTIDDNLALHVVPANCDRLSWAAWIFKANEPIIMGTESEIAAIGARLRYIIIKDLWEDKEVQKMMYRATRNRQDPIPGVVLKALVDSYVEYRGTKETKYWVFYLKPPSPATTAEEWNELRAHIRKKTIRDGNISITPALSKVGNQYCTICKLDSHPTFDCSFTRDNAVFQGPTKPIVGGNFEDRQTNSGRGKARGGRGRGSRSGWNKLNRGTRGDRARPA